MNRLRLLLFTLSFAAASLPASGQLSVDLQIKRRNFVRYEPILATVNVTNLSGRDLILRDGESQWFGFQITAGGSENLVPPRNPNYHLDPLELKAGATVKRTVNLSSLYSLGEFGNYRIKATIYSNDLNKFFASRADNIQVSDGRVIWQQVVGVPDGMRNGGATHHVSLLEFQDDKQYLYVRIENRETGVIFCTYQLAPLIAGNEPQVQFDTANNLYILQLVAPKTYGLSKISVNGDYLGQSTYTSTKSRPTLRRLADGTLQIAGGRREVAQTNLPQPKLSDRPAGLPTQ